MKMQFIYVRSQKQPWCEQAIENYLEKINHHCSFEVTEVKADRSIKDIDLRKNSEAKKILKSIKENYQLVLLDEKGQTFSGSKGFSHFLVSQLSQENLCFVAAGAYGAADSLRGQAQYILSLSYLTLSHSVAQVVALEQIYRALCIWRGLPYHNA